MYTVLLVVLAYHSDSVQHAEYKLHLHHVKLRQLRCFFFFKFTGAFVVFQRNATFCYCSLYSNIVFTILNVILFKK